MARLTLRVLGGFGAATAAGRPLRLPTRKTQALLAYLALSPGAGHPRDKLTALLWGDTADRRARHSLRQALSALRKALRGGAGAPDVLVEGEQVSLTADTVDVDAVLFERRVREGGVPALEEAVALYRGDLLEGLAVPEPAFEEWLLTERERLRDLALEALARLVGQHERRGALEAATRAAQRLLALDPLQEAAHRALMRLYARRGRRAAALRQYQVCLDTLQRELGAEPEQETRELYHALLRRTPEAPAAGADGAAHAEAPAAGAGVAAGADVASGTATVQAPAPPGGAPLVGRGDDLARLARALERARHGRGLVAAIVGEAGVGKSRLVEELVAAALARGTRVATGRAWEMEGALPLGPWIDAIQLDRLLPDLWPSTERPSGVRDDPMRLFEAVALLLSHLATTGPLLVVLEDLHWADATTLNLLSFITRRVREWAVLVVVTAREEELTPALARWLGELDEHGGMTLRLGRLSRPATHALVRSLAPPAAVAALRRLQAQAWALSEGNPFMVVETVRVAGERGRVRSPGRLPLPDRIRRVVLGRLERLSVPAQRVVAAAAVIGRELPFELLWRVAGLDQRQTAEQVEELVRRGLLRASGELLAFTHDGIRQVAGERLLEPTRRALHRAAAEALETLHPGRPESVLDQLAHHHARGGDAAKAVTFLTLAAEAAYRRAAAASAVRWLDEALEHARRLAPEAREHAVVDVTLRRATALSDLGRFEEILKSLEPLGEAVAGLGDPGLAGLYHFRVALTRSVLGEHEAARGAAQRALDEAARSGHAVTSAKAHYVLAVEGFTTGRALDGVEHGRRAVAALEPTHDRRWLSLAAWILGLNHLLLGEMDAALEAERRAEAVAAAIGDRAGQSFAAGAAAWVRLTQQDWPAACEAARRATDLAPDPATRATAAGLLAYAEQAAGTAGVPLARTARTLRQAIEQLGRFGMRQCLLLTLLADLHLHAGDLPAAQGAATRALALGTDVAFAWGTGAAQRLLGRVALARGATAEGRQRLADALRTFAAIPARLEVARTEASLAAASGSRARGAEPASE